MFRGCDCVDIWFTPIRSRFAVHTAQVNHFGKLQTSVLHLPGTSIESMININILAN